MRARFFGLIGLAAAMALSSQALAAKPVLRPDDMTIGDANAPVVVVEYASLSCPHCARFNQDVFPAFKKAYVDTGKALYVYREFITSPPEIAGAGVLLARCVPKADYFKVVDGVFAGQKEMYEDGTMGGVLKVLKRVGATVGVDETKFKACLTDKAAAEALDARVDRAVNQDKIDATPAFVVNGKKVEAPGGKEMDLATLEAAIKAAK
ncbi:disulfide bond formation protein DsbA [Caulobacter sp. CCUG 60055]|nr:thioredoxin domain-containing protein [Caulobacter sp. CCUG 60055]MBQ1543809.1 DsbA family protein [Caulobacteraceae bacterium]MCI3180729.1 disulfide bond formation protein DsbA [Caulobacter sp. CCUG 60055]